MTFAQRKIVVLTAWAAMVMTAGLVLSIDTPLSWVIVGSVAIIPIAISTGLWEAPEVALSKLVVRTRS